MLGRALVVWCALLAVAFANGTVRLLLIVPKTGDQTGHVISSLMLSAAILALAWAATPWIGPATPNDAIRVGGLWLALTLAFEFGAGHYLFGQPWSALLEDYNLARGRIWVIVLLATVCAPLATGWARGLFRVRVM